MLKQGIHIDILTDKIFNSKNVKLLLENENENENEIELHNRTQINTNKNKEINPRSSTKSSTKLNNRRIFSVQRVIVLPCYCGEVRTIQNRCFFKSSRPHPAQVLVGRG